MEFHTDSIFHIGRSHLKSGTPCQDYALSGVYERGAYAIVSDGCSSGGKTDFGSRILAHNMASTILCKNPKSVEYIKKAMSLSDNDMLATLVYAHAHNGYVDINILGDGAFAIVYNDGGIEMNRIEWAFNAPAYPVYSENDLQKLFALEEESAKPSVNIDTVFVSSDGDFISSYEDSMYAQDAVGGISSVYGLERVSFIAVFTDGVSQVDGMDWKDVVINLLSFKTTKGRFATRRMNRFVSSLQKSGFGPIDDIAMSVIRIEHDVKLSEHEEVSDEQNI